MALREPCEFTRSPTRVGRGSCTRSVAVIIELTKRRRLRRSLAGLVACDALGDRADVIRRRAAAAADDADAVALDELAEHLRDLLGRLGEDRLAVGALQRQPGVRDAVDRQRRVLAEVADRVAHVLGPGRAVEPDHVDVERVRASSARRRCPCRGASCRPAAGARPRSGSAASRPVALNASRAPKIAALTSRMSWAVSMMIRSAPPSTSPRACSSKTSTSRRKEMSPRVGSSEEGRKPVGPIEPATKRDLARPPCGRSRPPCG